MHGVLLLVSLAAGPQGPVKLAAAPLSVLNLGQKEADYYLEFLCGQLGSPQLEVTTAGQISALLGFERQKQLLGCGDDSASCLAELGSALGVDGMLRGSIGKFKQVYEVDFKIHNTRTGAVIARYSASAHDEELLPDVLRTGAEQLRRQLLAAVRPDLQVVEGPRTSVSTGRPWARLTPVLAGAAAIAAGAVLWSMSNEKARALDAGDTARVMGDPLAYANAARLERGLGIGLVVAGCAAAVAGALWFFLGSSEVAPVAFLGDGAAYGGIVGSFR